MYASLLTRRYLTSKVMPLLAAGAVALCTLMVLITWSVMGGFLRTLLDSGRTFVGDVRVQWPTTGFAYYEDLVGRLRKEPTVAGATAMIETFGLLGFDDGRMDGVNIRGIDPATYASVADYEAALWWKPTQTPVRKDRKREDLRLTPEWRTVLERVYEDGLRLAEADPETGVLKPAVVMGIEVSGLSERRVEGFYTPREMGQPTEKGGVRMSRQFAPATSVNISVLPLDTKGRSIEVSARRMPVANEFRSGIFEIDRRTIFLPLGALQRMLKMDEAVRVEPGSAGANVAEDSPFGAGADGRESFAEPRVVGVDPARATSVWVRAADGVTAQQLRDAVEAVYAGFARDHAGDVPSAELMRLNKLIATWEETNAVLVGAVKKETVLVIGLLFVISFVASMLILAIFWSMVAEKTKDIGILRALGASRADVAWVWLRYGLMIGVVGSVAGGLAALAVVRNINEIHEWLGASLGVQVWDPKVYYFTQIPNKVDPVHAAIVLGAGVGFSVLGALVPAVRAARMDPVRALRFE